MSALSIVLLIAISFVFGWIFAWIGLAIRICTASKTDWDTFVNRLTNIRNEHPDLWDKE